MSTYHRPAIEPLEFRDAEGNVIPYGERWGGGSPPEDTYSVDTHPERFAPLHAVAEALIAHLGEVYDVEVTEGSEVAQDFNHPIDDAVRAVRIQPRSPACAALTFAFSSYPGVHLHAGLLHDFRYPGCGCDACDETWEGQAEELERYVLAVVGGRFQEEVRGLLRTSVAFAAEFPDGSASGELFAPNMPKERLRAARRTLRSLDGGWAPWPRKAPLAEG
nr:hypothetical protein [Actinomycetales bacterium]